MNKRLSLWGKIKAYRLKNNVIVMFLIFVVFILSIVIYLQPSLRNNEVIGNIALAIFTSLLATLFAMAAECYVQYKTHENDQFLEDIHTFGIANLNKNKEELLKELLKDCDHEIWISGYRLILTDRIRKDIAEAVKRGAEVKAVLCPPWSLGFQLVYGKEERVMDHYFEVFHSIYEARQSGHHYDVVFLEKPLFSDTYKVDQNLVTGPYMHNRDAEYNRIMAKDFFSYNLVKKSRLYTIVENEFQTLYQEAVLKLDWGEFEKAYKRMKKEDLKDIEKQQLLKEACRKVEYPEPQGIPA